MSVARSLPESRYFRLEEVAERVWSATAVPGAGSMGNAGIVDLGNATLVFDTTLTPQAAEDLRAAAENLTGRHVRYVVNSHFHGDHVHGNSAFPDAVILATPRTRELIRDRTVARLEQTQQDVAAFIQQLDAEERRLAEESDDVKRRQGQLDLADWREFQQALPTMQVPLPSVAFEPHLVIHGAKRQAELMTYGGGHTDSDAFLYLPDDSLVLAGDLLFVQSHPLLIDGHPEEWIAILQRIEAMKVRTVVPGHGPAGTLDDCVRLRQYVIDLLALAREAVAAGKSAEEMKNLPIPEAYTLWDAADTFRWNMRFLHDYMMPRLAAPASSSVEAHAEDQPHG